MSNGCCTDLNILANHDGAGAAVDDHFRGILSRINLDVFENRQKADPLGRVSRCADGNRRGVVGISHIRAETIINSLDHPASRCEIRAQQMEGDGVALIEWRSHLPLNRGTIGNPPNAGNVHGDSRTVLPLCAEATHHQTALSHGIDLSISTFQ